MELLCWTCFLLVFVETFISGLGWALSLAIFARVILSWVQVPLPGAVQGWIFGVTEPILAPIRRAVPATIGLDFSPFIALIIVGLVRELLLNVLLSFALR